MKNAELAGLFSDLADMLEFQGENPFKPRAYRNASRMLGELPEDIAVVASENRLRKLPGVGEAIAEKIVEYLETGKVRRYEEAAASVPADLLKMLRIPGFGPRTAAQVVKALSIKTLKDLEEAARAGKLRDLPGMGRKKEENILRGLETIARAGERMLLGEALPLVEGILEGLRDAEAERIVYAGSLRRMRETIGDLDILACAKNGKDLIDRFCALSQVKEVLAQGGTKGSIVTHEGRQVDLRAVEPESFGAALQYFTGSQAHNIRLRDLAKRRNLKVNEYGVYRGDRRIAGETEESVYEALGLPWIPPELREDRGEVEAALESRLPDLIELDRIRGDLHAHTDWSDGHATMEEMAEAAKRLGYEYLVVSDHSRALKVFGGLSQEEVAEQIRAVDKANGKLRGIRLLTGIEVDIKSDGSLDLPDEALARLDFVTASVHSGFQQSRQKMTERMAKAARNEHVDAIGHPTGRLLGSREAYEVDLDAVMREAAKHKTAMEINANPHRLDLNDQACRRARELGVMIAINTDAHDTDQLELMRFGVATARRGWLTRKDVLNTRTLKQLLKWMS